MARTSNWVVEDSYTDKKGIVWRQESNKELGRRRVTSQREGERKQTHRTWTPNANRKADVAHYMDTVRQLF